MISHQQTIRQPENQRKTQQQVRILQQQNELLMRQLAQVRFRQQHLKKLNRILVENLGNQSGKEPAEALRQIKLIIQSDNFYSQKVIDFQETIDRINREKNQQVETRVNKLYKELLQKFNSNLQLETMHTQSTLCDKCLHLQSRNHQIRTIQIALRTEIQSLKKNLFETNRNRKPNREDTQIIPQLRQTINELNIENQNLREQIGELREEINVRDQQLHAQEEQWLRQLSNMENQHEDEISTLRHNYPQSHNVDQRDHHYGQNISSNFSLYQNFPASSGKKPSMMRQIKDIVSEINANRNKLNQNTSIISKVSTKGGASRTIRNISEYAEFSIKDAINRPNRGLTFY